MKTTTKSLLGASVFTIACAIATLSGTSSETENIVSANVNALSSGEINPNELCMTYCKPRKEEKCIFISSYGFEVTCHERTNWYNIQ